MRKANKKGIYWVIAACAAVGVLLMASYAVKTAVSRRSAVDSSGFTSPEAQWVEAHRDSDDPIDRAILASVTAAAQEPASLHSALDPRTSDPIRTAMQTLPVSAYPALWERACREPAYRPQKLTALEGFLAVPLNDLGLYDALAQRLWYERFTALKNDLPHGEMTAEDPARYGNLLLPLLADRLRGGFLTDAEEGIFRALVQGLGDNGYIPAEATAPVPDRAALLDWTDRNAPLLDAIRAIIEAEYEWVGVRLQATRAQGLPNETDPGPR